MKIGIAGFAGVGKSTVFHLLTGTAPDPQVGLKGQLGMAQLADPRLDVLTEILQPSKVRPISVELVDLPALVGENHTENARRLDLLREADGVAVVLGAFAGEDPIRQLTAFRDEMLLSDLTVATSRIERIKQTVSKARPGWQQMQQEQAFLEKVCEHLESGQPVSEMELVAEERMRVGGFRFLTGKPMLAVLNVEEDRRDGPPPDGLGAPCESVCARLELELAQLDADDREAFMQEMGIRSLARDRLLRAANAAMGQACFFTGEKDHELAAWAIPAGADAVTAAGKVHTDMARGFIRAEVVAFEALRDAGDMKSARAAGQVRTEGRDAIIHDGDVVLFLFNV